MAKVFQILVPDDFLVSRIISSENLVTELFVIDRADKKFVADNEADLKKPALYILVNRDTKQLYVGETDDSLKRLKNHEAKDFWTEAIVFHSTNDTLSTTEVKWLEARTYEVLKLLGYYDLSHNRQTPQSPKLKKNQIYTLEPVFEEAKNYVCAAGFDIFLKQKVENQEEDDSENDYRVSEDNNSERVYLSNMATIPKYFSNLTSKFIKTVMEEQGFNKGISDMNLEELGELRKYVAEKERKNNIHNEYACAISKLKTYLENGMSYREFEHDAQLVKKAKKETKNG
ncbi:MAG: hypothetical protein Q4A15_06600 [Prevotellaceae bacterium]|nr:hypothetical protein [Prevotellaceae bacterium]